jgi:nitrite reductase/ring-hydroxylating ferredoxin subunit/uncharacterized membrane protein
MRSKASLDGHPIHPMLIPLPFTFLMGAAAFNLAGRLAGRPAWWTTGRHMSAAGIWTALVAAMPGIIDYFYTVPPRSSGRRRATWHGLANLSAVTLFTLARGLRRRGDDRPKAAAIGAEIVGTGLLCAGGYMGGTLVYRNHIGVDPRYANAGRWSEETIALTGDATVVVAREDELEVDQMKLLHVAGRRLVLARHDEGYSVIDDRCTHKGGSLAGGAMVCGTVQCPWHGSQFDVASGRVRRGPAGHPIRVYGVEVRDGEVRLRVDLLLPEAPPALERPGAG